MLAQTRLHLLDVARFLSALGPKRWPRWLPSLIGAAAGLMECHDARSAVHRPAPVATVPAGAEVHHAQEALSTPTQNWFLANCGADGPLDESIWLPYVC